jgi:lipid-binding SYLF domain-containing protein
MRFGDVRFESQPSLVWLGLGPLAPFHGLRYCGEMQAHHLDCSAGTTGSTRPLLRSIRFEIAAVVPCAAAALLLWLVSTTGVVAQSAEADRVRESVTVLSEIMGAGDQSIPSSIMKKAEGIAVFPSLVRGGLIIGAQRGRGILSVKDQATGAWSSPAFLTITGGSIGAQIGAQAVDLVLVVQNRRGLEQLVRNQFKIGADAAVAAGPVGRDASAATDIQMRAQILSYSRTRGLFAGITLNGTTISQDRDANDRFYGMGYRTDQIVFEGRAGSPDPVGAWKAALERHTR